MGRPKIFGGDPLLSRKIKEGDIQTLNALVPLDSRIIRVQAQKFDALFKHYGIDQFSSDAWQTLAWDLAADFVPGFSLAQKRGAKPKSRSLHGDLWRAVIELRARKSLSVAAACEILSKTPPFKNKSGAELRREYYRERKTRGERLNAFSAGGVTTNALSRLGYAPDRAKKRA